MTASFSKRNFHFRFPAGTSRGILTEKTSFFLFLENEGVTGIGECSIIPDLSIDNLQELPLKLEELCCCINNGEDFKNVDLREFPSISFALETAIIDLKRDGQKILFPSDFTDGKCGIPINGLIWMGDKQFMQSQIIEKIEQGFRCIKLKIGALDFETELEIIKDVRENFSVNDIEIRLDANGGFSPQDALQKLKRLSEFDIHSIEQPIKPRMTEAMSEICEQSPIPIALDEELIGIEPNEELLKIIRPHFIILKPSLIGGFAMAEKWISLAEKHNIAWWITSALESNIGLNALAQWTATLQNNMPQGLGTGMLYENNIASPLEIRKAELYYNADKKWNNV
jgi:L-alanine-DL-glutamate epimerase and related enzymes of enolase superfamily